MRSERDSSVRAVRFPTARDVPVAVVIWFALLTMASASAQDKGNDHGDVSKASDSKKSTRIVLGSDSGEPGMSVTIPIYFSPAEEAKFGRLKLEIKFVSRNLKFAKFEDGIVAETGNLQMHTEIKEEKDEKGLEYSILTLEASQPKDGPTKAISSGLLGYVTFQISKDGRAADIGLRVAAEGADLATSKPIRDVSAAEGKVRVVAPGSIPLVSCFFFNH